MRAVVQRVARASVTVDGEVTGQIDVGLLVLVGAGHGDSIQEADVLAEKLVGLRIFPDDQGRMNLSVAEVGGGILVVSQFTLYGDARKGRRPSFVAAAPPEIAEPLVERVIAGIREAGIATASGRFGAAMEVELLNDGPVTLVLEVVEGKLV
ncbi:MAG: D-aminoacyl-tRNA deacylase [Acidimicrobiia bacterium]|nr:D-aminoacyl-tRNA deacylase [Acidimicrobiia bacterium]